MLALPLAFTACEPVTPGVENKEYSLNVTSESVLNFEAEGGQGVISYTLEEVTRFSPVAQPEVEATCEAEWITDITVAETITFNVAANEGEARETKIVVSYGEQEIEVAIKQAAKIVEPKPEDGVVFEAQVLTGEYYGDYYTPDAGNYYIFFSDYGFSEDGNLLTNSIYYQLDLYGVLYEGEAVNGYIPLPEGTYTLDVNETMAVGTIGYSYSCYLKTNNSEIEVEVPFEAAELVIAADGSCVLTATIQGEKHTVTFNGEALINDQREVNTGGEDQEMEAQYAYATYFGDQYSPDVADNFYFFLSDLGVDADGWEVANGKYYRFDLYSEIIETENGLAIPYGTYTISGDGMFPYTIGQEYSQYYVVDEYGWDYVVASGMTSGTVTISEEGAYADLMIGGANHIITYTGDITITDASSGGGGGYDGPYSTLSDDVTCNFDDHTLYYEFYGDYYEIGLQNWTFAIMPNDGEGDFVQFDVLTSADNYTDFYGEYTISNSWNEYTSYPGDFEYDYDYEYTYMAGSWYYTHDGYTMAPFVDGTLSVTDNGDGTATVVFGAYDDYDFYISGSWTGQMLSASEMATRSGSLKQAKSVAVKRSEAPQKRVIEVKKNDISKF